MSIKIEPVVTLFSIHSMPLVCDHKFTGHVWVDCCQVQLQSRKFTASRAQDPLIYNFIKSVNEKQTRRDSVNVIRKNSQHGWEWVQEVLVKKKPNKIIKRTSSQNPLLQNCWIFFSHHHQGPGQSSTIQVGREGRGAKCKKTKQNLLIIIIIIINNCNERRNKNISNRQTQSPQYKTRFCSRSRQPEKSFIFFPFF